jgi:hypothetical protein
MPVGSDSGVAQDATLQALILSLGGPIVGMANGSGTGVAQDASLQQILALLGGGLQPGATFTIRMSIALVTKSSVEVIPATAIVVRAYFDNDPSVAGTAAYSAGATISIGTAANPTLFMGPGDSNPQIQALYDAPQDTPSTSGNALLVTVTGAPAAGAGWACIEYSIPLS